MASNITHVVFAKKALQTILFEKSVDITRYYVGTLFPDIRKLGTLSRKDTHITNPTIEELLKITDSFQIGIYVHSLVDYERETILDNLGMYTIIEKNYLNQTALKLLEDEIFYNEIDNWHEIAKYFTTIYREELALLPNKQELLMWHSLNKSYLLKKKNAREMAESMKVDESVIRTTLSVVDQFRNNPQITRILHQLYENIFSNYK